MIFFVSYPISFLDPYQPSGLRALIWGMIQRISYNNLLCMNLSEPFVITVTAAWCCKLMHLMTKPTTWSVRPAKTQISLGICPVWSESLLYAQWVAQDPSFLHADSEDWSDWADDLSLRWAHMPFYWFCREAAQLTYLFLHMILFS